MKRFVKKILGKHLCDECLSTAVHHFKLPDFDSDEVKDLDCYYCNEHAKKSGFCLWCGTFCAGIESFDFSGMPGYCSECVDDIKAEFGEYDDDYQEDWQEAPYQS